MADRLYDYLLAVGAEQGWGGGGGGAHSSLTGLGWAASGHTGTASRIAAFDGSGSASYLQIGVDVQAYSATLAAIAAGTWTGATSITTLGTITTGTWSGTAIAVVSGGTGSTTASGARSALGLAIGADVQAYDADLTTLAAVSSTDGHVWRRASGTWGYGTLDAASIASGTLGTARLGSGSATSATYLRGDSTWGGLAAADLTGTVAAANLGTGSTGTLDQWQKLCADGVWRVAGGPTVSSVSKTSDTTLSSTGLTMSGLPVGTYRLQIFSVHTGNATGGIKIQLVTTNGTCRWRAADRDGGTVVNTESSTPNYSVSASEQAIVIDGWVNITSSTGTIDLHMAQNSSNATSTTIVRATMDLTETS